MDHIQANVTGRKAVNGDGLPTDRLATKRDVARFVGCTESGLNKMLERGNGPPFVRAGRLVRFWPNDVRAWLENSRSDRAV